MLALPTPCAPPTFLAEAERKAEELVTAAEALCVHGRGHEDVDPKGGDILRYLGF